MTHFYSRLLPTLCLLLLLLFPPPTILAATTNVSVRQDACPTIYQLRLGISFDSTFCAAYGTTYGVAAHMATTAIAQAEKLFLDQACIQLSVVFISGYCTSSSDPYSAIATSNDAFFILDEFEAKFTHPASVPEKADLNLLFVGFDVEGAYGLAVTASVCSGEAFAYVAKARPFAVIHEVAHALSCRHVDPTQDGSVPQNVMQSTVSPDVPWIFLPVSTSLIATYAASDQGTCMNRTTAPVAYPAPVVVGGTAFETCAALKVGTGVDELYKGGKNSTLLSPSRFSFRVKIRQKKNTIRVAFKGVTTVFTALAFRLSTVPALEQFEVGEWRFFNNGKKNIKYKVPYDSVISTESSPTSCCGQVVRMYFGLIRCDPDTLTPCSRVPIFSIPHTIKCKQ